MDGVYGIVVMAFARDAVIISLLDIAKMLFSFFVLSFTRIIEPLSILLQITLTNV